MVKKSEDWLDKQLARVRVSTEDYKKGIMAPERDPIAAALAANDKRKEGIRRSLEDETWEKTMRTLTKEDWSKPALTLGAARFVPGVEAKKDKINKFITAWRPILEGVQADVRAMPEVTDADREGRMLENLRAMKTKKGTWR